MTRIFEESQLTTLILTALDAAMVELTFREDYKNRDLIHNLKRSIEKEKLDVRLSSREE